MCVTSSDSLELKLSFPQRIIKNPMIYLYLGKDMMMMITMTMLMVVTCIDDFQEEGEAGG